MIEPLFFEQENPWISPESVFANMQDIAPLPSRVYNDNTFIRICYCRNKKPIDLSDAESTLEMNPVIQAAVLLRKHARRVYYETENS